MTSTAPISPTCGDIETRGGALQMLAQGLPIMRTLDAIAALAAHVQQNTRCAIVLVEGDSYCLAAQRGLSPEEQKAIEDRCQDLPGGGCAVFEKQADVRLLLTQASELVGYVLVYGLDRTLDVSNISARLDEVCSLATLAVEQKHLAEELSYRAHHDPLTHLWNRVWMEDEITRSLLEGADTGCHTGLLTVGVDSFRLINGLLGSQAGNTVLQQIAQRLKGALEPGFSIARGGGDEFQILMPYLTSPTRVQAFASQLRTWFVQPFEFADHELIIRVSIGAAVAGPGECGTGDLQNRVDTALRHAKKFARSRISLYEPSMALAPPERLVMEKHVRFALQKRELEIYYQPQIEVRTGRVVGVEALLRWRHASLGFIAPALFIPIVEEMGLIDEIGDWVIGEAIRQLEAWNKAGLPNLRMAVNVSAIQFSRSDFATSVARRLRTSSIDPEDLELEITESAVMTDFEHGLRQMRLLRSLGVAIAVDDFGTGHSSLAYLEQMPIQRLKIDRMFIKGVTSRYERPPLLSSIIQMCHALGCAVIAEGVETLEQAMALSAMRCEEIQGFYYARPMPPAEFQRWLAECQVTSLAG